MRLKLCCAAIAVVLALAGAGCGDDSSSDGNGGQTSASTTTEPTRTIELFHHVNRLAKPRGPGPHPGARVDQLIVRDIREGVGRPLEAGDTGVFDFISTDWITGRPVDSSWRRRRPFETRIEKGVVIDGWWQGIPGMRVGGRRQIVIPPALGFTQSPELVRATTYFDVVLVEIRPQAAPGFSEGGAEGGAPPIPGG